MGSWVNPSPQKYFTDYCHVFGSIYFTNKASDADFVVFVESEEAFANVVIFEEKSLAFANKQGKWHTVEDARLADFYIYITTNISQSDFTIAYTDVESFAGCPK